MKKKSLLSELGLIAGIIVIIIGFISSVCLDSKIPGVIGFLLLGVTIIFLIISARKSTTNEMDKN